MDEKEAKNNIPCIIDNGILYNPKDIQRVLRDLGQVSYQHIIDGEIKASGEGYVVHVSANNSSANIIVNKRIYLNVSGFEYMKINTQDDQAVIELVERYNTLKFTPMNILMSEENLNNTMMLSPVPDYSELDYDDEEFAEINFDDDLDDE